MSAMKGQAIVVTQSGVQVVPETADLIVWMEARGFIWNGRAASKRLRPELQGQPTFEGLCGPMWGGEEHPLRYEDWETNDQMSR
jgi:hypothetical protein